jgi:hypothetical protein
MSETPEVPQQSGKLQTIMYERMQVKIYYPTPIRKGKCVCCSRTIASLEIKTTQMHHTVYKYERDTVRKNPVLALDYTLELCFGCHPIADGFRELLLSNPRGGLRNLDRIIKVGALLPQEQQDHFTALCKRWLSLRNGNR